jgi:hypothetical protein
VVEKEGEKYVKKFSHSKALVAKVFSAFGPLFEKIFSRWHPFGSLICMSSGGSVCRTHTQTDTQNKDIII